MGITSLSFFIFVSITLFIYFIVPKKYQWVVLLLSSVFFFFANSTVHTVIYVTTSIVSVYYATIHFDRINMRLLDNVDENEIQHFLRRKRWILIFVLLINVGILAVLKYTNLFINTINIPIENIFNNSISEVSWIAPLGISFYTLQIISYLLDSYWGTIEVQRNIGKIALFTLYFPQMTSGPISRFKEIGTQLFIVHKCNYKRMTFGLQRIMWGLFKKLVVSERLGLIVHPIYDNPTAYGSLFIWGGTFAFTLQLYTDFSGCMDIVLGVSECFGINLPENFKQPFFSKTIQELWSRWHITLGTWLKDYIMFPILKSKRWIVMGDKLKKRYGKKVGKTIPTYLGMFILWLSMGLWHGNSWKYILGEGVWFWLVIVIGQVTAPIFKNFKFGKNCFTWILVQRIRTFILFSIGMMFFRASDLNSAITVLWQSLKLDFSFASIGINKIDLIILILGLLVVFIISILNERSDVREIIANQKLYVRWLIYLFVFWFVVILGLYGPQYDSSNFIYQFF